MKKNRRHRIKKLRYLRTFPRHHYPFCLFTVRDIYYLFRGLWTHSSLFTVLFHWTAIYMILSLLRTKFPPCIDLWTVHARLQWDSSAAQPREKIWTGLGSSWIQVTFAILTVWITVFKLYSGKFHLDKKSFEQKIKLNSLVVMVKW